ncbi:MAG: N-acetyltransferase, partial [Sphingomonas sp.]|nr:N-acetyltransferase [Sphingomonas sp.]
MEIRSEEPGDEQSIFTVITAAFAEAQHSGGNEARIVEALRAAKGLAVSLVAIRDDAIVGHVAFSLVTMDGQSCGWFGLGPVAVMPALQRHGIGTALINAGLSALRERGAGGCVVLGDPAYYGRFGFKADT